MVVTKGDNQTDGWLGKVVDRQSRETEKRAYAVERHLFGLLRALESLTSTGSLSHCSAWVYFWPAVEMKDSMFRHELFG